MLARSRWRSIARPVSQAGRVVAVRSLSTLDEQEIQKFNAVSEDWWDPKSTTGVGLLHQLNPVRVGYIREQSVRHFSRDDESCRPLESLQVADIGCGGGILSEALCRIGATMTSIDPGVENVAAAQAHASQGPCTQMINYRCCSSEDLVQEGQQFDIVCSLEVVEHVADVPAFVSSLTDLVKPGGLLFMSTLNRTLLSYALAIGAAEYMFRFVPPGTHDWNKFIRPDELKQLLDQRGMQVQDVSGIVGDPVLSKWQIDPSCTAINYILCASKPME